MLILMKAEEDMMGRVLVATHKVYEAHLEHSKHALGISHIQEIIEK